MIKALVAALGMIIVVGGCASSRSLSHSLNDIDANSNLKAILFADRDHDYGDIDLTLFEGRLMLTGTMRSEEGRAALIKNAWKADGVVQVIDEVFVGEKTSFGQGLTDARIDTGVRARLIADGDVRSSDIKIAVSNGVVYLLGVARDQAALEEILHHARTTGDVSKVVSHVLYMDAPDRRL